MAKINVPRGSIHTHEGAVAKHITPELQLRRSVMSCMLWESEFYEDGQTISDRIINTIPKVTPEKCRDIAIEARSKMKLRHVPLLIAREMSRLESHKHLVSETLANIIQRPDELTEFLAIYWKDGRQPLSAQVKKGLATAFANFNAYQLAKYDREGTVKLRDVLFLSHAKPKDPEQEAIWKKLIDGTLEAPDTWEVNLSAGANKKETWERLLSENKLGALALLRNLRNFQKDNVKEDLILSALSSMKVERVLPFRFIAAARYAPQWEPNIEDAMMKCLQVQEKLFGHTVLLVDVSGSMEWTLSDKSEMCRMDAACGVAILLREICDRVDVITFSDNTIQVPSRHGFALRDAIVGSQRHNGTYLGGAVNAVYSNFQNIDRLVVITDEQSHDTVPNPKGKGYMINVASNRNGVGYGPWHHIDGWSEAVINYICEYEKAQF